MEIRLAADEYSGETWVLQGSADRLNQVHVERGCLPQTTAERGGRAIENGFRTFLVAGFQEQGCLRPKPPVGSHKRTSSVPKKLQSGRCIVLEMCQPEGCLRGGICSKPS